ncbi:type IV secretory pathway, VirB3 component [Burkholderia sp. Ch1-1]|nr:type IV secretory pathway, VirB3 component [Burkholderia sp. Ch1-1]
MAKKFPLFKGATRVPTWAFVPRDVFILTFMFSGALFMIIHFYAIAIFALLWLIEWAITKHDDRAFRIIWVWLKTKVRNRFDSRFTGLWGGSSYSPVDYTDPVVRANRDEV